MPIIAITSQACDPATATLTFTSYAGGEFTFTLSAAIPSTAVTISVAQVFGYTATNCSAGTPPVDTLYANLVIAAGSTVGTIAGDIGFGCTYLRYTRDTPITVNGVSKGDGQTLTIGGTTVVTVVISGACTVYTC